MCCVRVHSQNILAVGFHDDDVVKVSPDPSQCSTN